MADSSPAPPPVALCTTAAELAAALAALAARDAACTARLASLLASSHTLAHALTRLDLLRSHLSTQIVSARALTHAVLSPPSATASRVTAAVRALDTEHARVQSTLTVVSQVGELKTCVLGVVDSMGAPQDWETAAAYIARARQLPPEIVTGSFAEEMVPSAEVPDPPAVTLESAAESLCGLFLREFEKAAAAADGEKVTRFFKLFPLIGRTEVGLDVYGRYVCQGVAVRAREELAAATATAAAGGLGDYAYANALSRLFEHIASIVEQHGGLVERHYGGGRMVRVIERLQVEADTQGGIIIDTFTDERGISRRLTDVKAYAFSFLVQSFLPQTRSSVGGGTSDTAPRSSSSNSSEDSGVDVKEIDMLLSELSIMLSRWSLYIRFITRKCLPPPSPPSQSPTLPPTSTSSPPPTPTLSLLPAVLQNSSLLTKIEHRLATPFSALTTFFIRRSVEKAFQLDEAPTDLTLSLQHPVSTSSNPPFITSAVDDVMYILQTHLQRTLTTSHAALVTASISTVARVLCSDFIGMIQRKLQVDSYPRPSAPGAPPPESKVTSFMVLLNTLDVARDYTARITAGLGGAALQESFPAATTTAGGAGEEVLVALAGLEAAFGAKSKELVKDGVGVFFSLVVKPRLRPLLTEAWREVEYVVDASSPTAPEDGGGGGGEGGGLQEVEGGGEEVKMRFQHGWEAVMTPYKRILTPRCFEQLLSVTAGYFARLLENRIWGYAGRVNELGAIRLERDVAGVVGVVVRGGSYGVRDVFARCVQICLIVNMEEDEVAGVMGDADGGDRGEGAVEWRLDREERRRARGMVVVG